MMISFLELEKALASLKKALSQPKNEFTRDASIQRFEFTFELTWKTAKKVLRNLGIQSLSPRTVIRDMGQQGWIENIEFWFSFLDQRNLTSHTYNELVAEEVYATAKAFAEECEKILVCLKAATRVT